MSPAEGGELRAALEEQRVVLAAGVGQHEAVHGRMLRVQVARLLLLLVLVLMLALLLEVMMVLVLTLEVVLLVGLQRMVC